jgi:hypothetical protein
VRRSRKLLFRFELVGVGNFISRENIEEILKKELSAGIRAVLKKAKSK